MKKCMKKIAAAVLAATLAAGMSMTAFAAPDSNLNTSRTAADTASINLIKDYVVGSATQANTISPQETFIFNFANYGLWNVGENGSGTSMYTVDTMPSFNASYSITATAGEAESASSTKPSAMITLPTYNAVGDYWYKVEEVQGTTAGVIYGTNDNNSEDLTLLNGNHSGIYYLHVQVTNGAPKGEYVRTVTMHKTAPAAGITNTEYETWYASNNENPSSGNAIKVSDIQNKYYAGTLKVTKTVTGNAGDKNELFKVQVVFHNATGKDVNSNMTYANALNATGNVIPETSITWVGDDATVEFYVKDETTVTFNNIPYGVTYVVTETQPADDKYTHAFSFDSEDASVTFNNITYAKDGVVGERVGDITAWDNAKATGTISDDLDTVTITNNKESVIDIGVFTTNAPYIAILCIAAGALVIFMRRRKNMIEE